MIILAIRTEKPEAEVGLYDNYTKLSHETWKAHRQLAETLHKKILDILKAQGKGWEDIEGISAYEGPGSFTGLRIGLSFANALAYSQGLPIAGTSGADWIQDGIRQLLEGKYQKIVMPEYGAEPHITTPKK